MKNGLFNLCFLSLLIVGCAKNGNINPSSSNSAIKVSITSLSVNMGPFNTSVTINGSGFGSTLADDKVFFNGKAANVSSASDNQIIAIVPLGAGTGNVSVQVKNGATVSGPVFNYVLSAVVTTFAGNSTKGSADGTGKDASFSYITGMGTDQAGNLYVADGQSPALLRKITPAGVVSTIPTNGAASVLINGLAIDKAGSIFILDLTTHSVRKLTTNGTATIIAGGKQGTSDGIGTAATFTNLNGITVDDSENLYVTDGALGYNFPNLIRKISTNGTVTTIAGNFGNRGMINGNVNVATFNVPGAIVHDANGNLYIGEEENYAVRKLTPDGFVSTLAGNGTGGSADGLGTSATFGTINGIAIQPSSGNLYVFDSYNAAIREVTLTGLVTTIAGNGSQISVDGIGKYASFNDPLAIAIAPTGEIYVSEHQNIIRKIVMQ